MDGSYKQPLTKWKDKNVGGNFPWFSGLNTKLINSKRPLFQAFEGQGDSERCAERKTDRRKLGIAFSRMGRSIYIYINT